MKPNREIDRPVKKRLRLLVGASATCLALVALFLWLPSEIDPRFVGTWHVDATPYVYKLGSDGVFTYMIDGEPVRRTRWRVRDGVFYSLQDEAGWAMFRGWINRIRNPRARDDSMLEVISIAPNAIVMREYRSGGQFTLNRVAESFIPRERQNVLTPEFRTSAIAKPDDKPTARWQKIRRPRPEAPVRLSSPASSGSGADEAP